MRFIVGLIYRLRNGMAEAILHPLAKNVAQLVSSQSIAAVIRLGTTVYVVRILTPAEYGTAALLMVYPNLLLSIIGTKSQKVTIRYLSLFRTQQNRAELRGICKLAFAVDLLVATLVFVCVGVTANWYSLWFNVPPGLSWLMIVYAGSFPFLSLGGTSSAILNSHREFRRLAFLNLLHPLVNLVGVVGLLSLGFGVAGVIVAVSIASAVNAVTMNVVATRVLYRDGSGFWWHGKWKSVKPFRRELFRVLSWNYLGEAMRGVLDSAPPMLLGYYRPVEEVGFYRLAMNLANTTRYFEHSMGRVVYPVLSARSASVGPWVFTKTLRRLTLQAGCPMALMLLMVVFLLPTLVPVVFGLAYDGAILGAQVLIGGGVFCLLFFWVTPVYFANNQVDVFTKRFAAYVGITLAVMWLCVERWGLVGLAGALALGRAAFFSTMAGWMLRHHGKSVDTGGTKV